MRVLQIGRRIVLNGRKIALAVVACFNRCCAPSTWNRADLCNDGDAPPEIPRRITFPTGFTCLDGCQISGGRLIIYRGYCYFVVSGPGEVQCQGPRDKPAEYPAPYFGATVVTWAELVCKPLASTCLDQSCLPVEPGCCTRPVTGPCGVPQLCNLPKKFRITHTAFYRWRSTVYDDPGACAGLFVCEEATTEVNAWAEYACDENNIDNLGQSTPVLTNSGGFIRLIGHNLTPQGNDINGTYAPYASPTYTDLKTAVGFGFGIPLRNNNFCGGSHSYSYDDPPGCATSSDICDGVRRIITETVRCNYWTLDRISYEDCFLFDESFSSTGVSAPPCSPDERWNDVRQVRITLSGLVGCENAPAWDGGPVGEERPYPYPITAQTTAEMLEGMA